MSYRSLEHAILKYDCQIKSYLFNFNLWFFQTFLVHKNIEISIFKHIRNMDLIRYQFLSPLFIVKVWIILFPTFWLTIQQLTADGMWKTVTLTVFHIYVNSKYLFLWRNNCCFLLRSLTRLKLVPELHKHQYCRSPVGPEIKTLEEHLAK